MSSQSPLSETIAVANGYITAARQLLVMYATLKELAARASDNGVAGYLAQMGTVAVKVDGSLATTPDQAPNPANPIDPTAYPTMLQPISMNQLIQVKTALDAVISYIEGGAPAANPGARAILHAANRS